MRIESAWDAEDLGMRFRGNPRHPNSASTRWGLPGTGKHPVLGRKRNPRSPHRVGGPFGPPSQRRSAGIPYWPTFRVFQPSRTYLGPLFRVSSSSSTPVCAHSNSVSQSQRRNSSSSVHWRVFLAKHHRQHPICDPLCRRGVAYPQPVITKESRCRTVVAQPPSKRHENPVGTTGIRKTPRFGPKTKSP